MERGIKEERRKNLGARKGSSDRETKTKRGKKENLHPPRGALWGLAGEGTGIREGH